MEDVRNEWRILAIERKAEEAKRKADEIDSLRSDVGRLERSNRELSSYVNGVRDELEAYKNEVESLLYNLREKLIPDVS